MSHTYPGFAERLVQSKNAKIFRRKAPKPMPVASYSYLEVLAPISNPLAPAPVQASPAPAEIDITSQPPSQADRRSQMIIDNTHCCGFRYLHGLQSRVVYPLYHKLSPGAVSARHEKEGNAWVYYSITPLDLVLFAADKFREGSPCGQYAFVEALVKEDDPAEKAEALIALITEKQLGTVTCIPAHRNPNSGNYLHTFIWNIDRHALEEFRG